MTGRKSRAQLPVPICSSKSYQRVTFLSKGATFLTSPIPVGLVKMCAVCPGAEFRTQRFSHGRRQAESQTVPGSRVREVITGIREVTENLTSRGTHWEITLCFVFHCCGLSARIESPVDYYLKRLTKA